MSAFSAVAAEAHPADCQCRGLSRRHLLGSLAAAAAGLAMPAIGSAATGEPTRIDAHHHYYPSEAKKLGGLGGKMTEQWTPQTSIDEMDRNGVRTAILSMATPPMAWFRLPNDESRSFVRAINDYGARMVADYPGRFGLFAFLSMVDVEGTLREIEYAFDTLKADGVEIGSGFGDIYPGDPKFLPVFEELNRRKALLYIHPTTQPCCAGAIRGLNDSVIEVPHDTTRCVMSLLMSGNMSKMRDIRFLWSHGGGTIPMLAGRIDWLMRTLVKNSHDLVPEGPVAEFRRFYYDTANAAYPGSMAALMKMVDPSHIVFGTDYPYVTTDWNVKALHGNDFSADMIRAIETTNIAALVPRLKS